MRSENHPADARILSDERRASMERLVRLRGSYDGALAGYLRDDRAARARPAVDDSHRPLRAPAGRRAACIWSGILAAAAVWYRGGKLPRRATATRACPASNDTPRE